MCFPPVSERPVGALKSRPKSNMSVAHYTLDVNGKQLYCTIGGGFALSKSYLCAVRYPKASIHDKG